MSRDARASAEVPVSGSPSSDAAPAAVVASANAPAEMSAPPARAIGAKKRVNGRTLTALRALGALTAREKAHLVREILQVRGLMPLLMKPRNGQRWTPEDKSELGKHLRRLSKLSPYLVIGVMPGGFLLLPALAWWLDRRRNRTASRRSTES